jgi:hypothetical protein
MVWDPRIELGESCSQGRRRTLHHVPDGPSSSSRTSLSPSSAERCHRVSCRGMRHRVRVSIPPGRFERPTTSPEVERGVELVAGVEPAWSALRVRCSPTRARPASAARAGFEPAVGRLTAACVSASPPGNASRRAQPRRARCASSARPFELSKIRARRELRAQQGLRRDDSRLRAPSGFVESRTRSIRLRGGCSAN